LVSIFIGKSRAGLIFYIFLLNYFIGLYFHRKISSKSYSFFVISTLTKLIMCHMSAHNFFNLYIFYKLKEIVMCQADIVTCGRDGVT